MANKFNTKKWLQIGAYATDALSKGSAGGLGKAIVEADVDLSGRNPSGNAFNEQNTKDTEGKDLSEFQKAKNKWMPEKEILGDFPSKKNSNYNV